MFTLFIPGLEPASADSVPRQPALERLLARGRARPLEISPWALLARLAGGDLGRWPVGPVSALGELAAPPQACLRIEPLGGENERHGVFRLPAASLAIERHEAEALADAFRATLGAGRLRLDIASPERWYLALDGGPATGPDVSQNAGPHWAGFAGPARSLADDERPAPPEAELRLLLSEVEMLFHAHPVNVARRERAAPGIAGLHPWGGGRLAATATAGISPHVSLQVSPQVSPLIEEPYLAGLRRLGAVRSAGAASCRAGPATPDGIAWPAAVETLDAQCLADVEANWAAPLLAALLRGRVAGVRIVTGRAVHETRRLDALRFWRRPRPMAELC